MRCDANCIQDKLGIEGRRHFQEVERVDRQEARMWESPKVVTEGERKPKRK